MNENVDQLKPLLAIVADGKSLREEEAERAFEQLDPHSCLEIISQADRFAVQISFCVEVETVKLRMLSTSDLC